MAKHAFASVIIHFPSSTSISNNRTCWLSVMDHASVCTEERKSLISFLSATTIKYIGVVMGTARFLWSLWLILILGLDRSLRRIFRSSGLKRYACCYLVQKPLWPVGRKSSFRAMRFSSVLKAIAIPNWSLPLTSQMITIDSWKDIAWRQEKWPPLLTRYVELPQSHFHDQCH